MRNTYLLRKPVYHVSCVCTDSVGGTFRPVSDSDTGFDPVPGKCTKLACHSIHQSIHRLEPITTSTAQDTMHASPSQDMDMQSIMGNLETPTRLIASLRTVGNLCDIEQMPHTQGGVDFEPLTMKVGEKCPPPPSHGGTQ